VPDSGRLYASSAIAIAHAEPIPLLIGESQLDEVTSAPMIECASLEVEGTDRDGGERKVEKGEAWVEVAQRNPRRHRGTLEDREVSPLQFHIEPKFIAMVRV
jgi:hypothetical protein